MRVETFRSVQELENALNLWAVLVPEPEILVQGGLFYITNLPDLGEQLVLNPRFENGGDNWTPADGWSFSNNQAHCDGSQASQINLVQNVIVEVGKTYLIDMGIASVDAGNVRNDVGGASPTDWYNVRGIHKAVNNVLSGVNFFITNDADFIGSIDYVFCYEILE